jgi:membrane protein implicated in regulation of membrane protease activity
MFRNLFALFASVILLVLGFMFSVVILAVIALLGLCALGYVWWQTRKLRRAIRTQDAGPQTIDGEAVVIEEYHRAEKILPEDPSSQ